MAMKFLLVICAVCLLLNNSYGQKFFECNKNSERRIDEIMSKILTIGNSGRKFPVSNSEVGPYCQDTYGMIKNVKNYTKSCMVNLPKQVTLVFIHSVENVLNQICKKDNKKRQELLTATPCGNKASNPFNKCVSNFIDSLLGTKNSKDDKLKIPYICCEYHKINACMTKTGKTIDICDDNKLKIVNQFVESLTGSLLDLLCGEYEEGSNKCSQLGPPPKKTKDQRRTKSFLLPLVDVLSSFPES